MNMDLEVLSTVVAEKRLAVEQLGAMQTCSDELEMMRQYLVFGEALDALHAVESALAAATASGHS